MLSSARLVWRSAAWANTKLRKAGRARLHRLFRGWVSQRHVLGALFMREIQVRWGRRNLGFLWLFAEPLVFALPVLAMWSAIRGHTAPGGMPMISFLWSGYLPLLVF